MKPLRLAVILDPVETLNPKKDSTLAMIEEALRRNWQVHVLELKDLSIHNGKAFGNSRNITLDFNASPWYQMGSVEHHELADFSVILMRTDPPVDMHYIHATFVLDLAEQAGSIVMNRPQSLRDANEKTFLAHFPQCAIDTIFSMDRTTLKTFVDQHQKVVLKPLDGMGGKSVFVVHAADMNLNVILETLSRNFSEMITAQKYIPEITEGDRRILVINGEPVSHALARIPGNNDHRGNLAAGGTGKVLPLSDRDRWVCQQTAPTLIQKGIAFAGLDVIGDYLTEVNVTSPTCIREIEVVTKISISGKFFDYIESLL